MNIYFSGLGGVGIGPLTEIARDAGHNVMGSDLAESLLTEELRAQGVELSIGQDGSFLKSCHEATPLDWFVYTAALPANHPELILARELGIRTGKRDEFLAEFITQHNLKLLAVTGTHGKTTTSGMLVWALQQLGIPVSYSIGTTLSFGPSGAYDPASEYFVYECDEYDRNFLHFLPQVALIASVDYDHPDTYPTKQDYDQAFRSFIAQSKHVITWQQVLNSIQQPVTPAIWALQASEVLPLPLHGDHNRRNASLVVKLLEYLEIGSEKQRTDALQSFPGTDRRFEKLADNLYSDYGHHPEEIVATLQLASELSDHIVLIYQPHQNIRQHAIKNDYTTQFEGAETVVWLPTYLSREDPALPILTPAELSSNLTNKQDVRYYELDDNLWNFVQEARQAGKLVLCMGAGIIDEWVRSRIRG